MPFTIVEKLRVVNKSSKFNRMIINTDNWKEVAKVEVWNYESHEDIVISREQAQKIINVLEAWIRNTPVAQSG